MGELRAYVVPAGALRTLLAGGPAQRDRVVGLVRDVLPAEPPPTPFGPVFTRVPGTRAVPDDEPAPADLGRLLAGRPVPTGRLRATWRLVEAVAAGLATATARVRSGPPTGLGPLGLALPTTADVAAGTWSPARAAAVPGLALLAGQAGADGLVVFWTAGEGRGPTG